LVAVSILLPTISALPGDSIAGHAPLIVIHTLLAYGKPTSAIPAKDKCFAAAVTLFYSFIPPLFFSLFQLTAHFINNAQ
jgi:hypothetical protein